MKKLSILLAFIVLRLVITDAYAANHNAETLPLLPEGKYVSMIKGFNVKHPQETEANMDSRWNEAVSKGMKTGNIQIDWSELEPRPYRYDKEILKEALQEMQAQGLKPFVVLSTIDSEEFTIPEDLLDDSSPTWLKRGRSFDNPVLLKRFKRLLNWVVPMIVEHGGWALSVGNEPSGYLADNPSQETSMVNFLKAARNHAHKIDPNLAITMTLSQVQFENGSNFHEGLIEESDFVSFNYYAITPDYFSSNPADVNQEVDDMLEAAGDKYLVLQELGAPAGYENIPSHMNASFSKQQQFLENVFAKMESEPRFKAATIFQLVDWDPELVDSYYVNFFIQEGIVSLGFINRLAESLETTGLLHYADGSTRPAWFTFTKWLERLNGQNL